MRRFVLFVVIVMVMSGCASPRGVAAFEELFSDGSWQEVPEGYQVTRGPSWHTECLNQGSGPPPHEPKGSLTIASVDQDLPRDDAAVVEHYRMIADGNGWTAQPSWSWLAEPGNVLNRQADVNGVSFRMYVIRDDVANRFVIGFQPEPWTFCSASD